MEVHADYLFQKYKHVMDIYNGQSLSCKKLANGTLKNINRCMTQQQK